MDEWFTNEEIDALERHIDNAKISQADVLRLIARLRAAPSKGEDWFSDDEVLDLEMNIGIADNVTIPPRQVLRIIKRLRAAPSKQPGKDRPHERS
jgi:hypothetical protein